MGARVDSHGILIEIVGDESSYIRSGERTIAFNTKIDTSFRQVGVSANLSAEAQIKAALKAQEALRVNASLLGARAASLPAGSREQTAATLLAAEAQAKYARSIGVTTTSTRQMSGASKTAERDLGKSVRGALAGSGAFASLGRSLAFASGGFLAFSIGAEVIGRSITAAEDLAKAQRSLDVAIAHTGGNVTKLRPLYDETAKAAAQFGQSESDALSGLARATVLTGDAEKAQRAYREALVISKATGKDFGAVLIATAKGQEGVTTSLRRYGILVATTSTGQEQFTQVMKRFGGQAAANTSASDKLHASVANFEETLGTALLPTFDRLAGRLTVWLDKMEKSGRLQKDVNHVVSEAGGIFHTLGGALKVVDTVTGSFERTLELVLALKFASVIAGWIGSLGQLKGAWGGVTVAAETAAAAETSAAAAGVGAGAAAGAGAAGVAARVGMYTGAGSAFAARKLPVLGAAALGAGLAIADSGEQGKNLGTRVVNGWLFYGATAAGSTFWTRGPYVGYSSPRLPANFGQLPAVLGGPSRTVRAGTSTGPFGSAKPETQFTKSFGLNQAEQITAAQASLTRTTTDDVAAAKQVVARIKRLIDQGRLHGAALIQALGLEASAMSTIWSAEDAAAQKRAAAAQAAQARIQAQIQDSIDPLKLEVALSRDQALGLSTTRELRRLKSAAEKALKSGKLSLQQQKEAWDQITSINQQFAGQSKASTAQFKQASTRALTAGLHLSAADREELRARLSQLGPGRTRPRDGVGAYGYEIGAHSHRPIHVHTSVKLDGKKVGESTTKHQQRRERRNSSQRRGPHAG